ncbi:hypothetical protein SCP_0207570 [Sparassis crispa]|uniref:Uncharacterized protein n=1 Tax=Sparassis crispa TaxID=139825 RepID=A0A401GBN3_9APHY|nr:hypothetical protein SCP_0207570 [Sparassis crispa]GBE79557.1 hypothetical protein SCP_0207570 [Sparassis crispa]
MPNINDIAIEVSSWKMNIVLGLSGYSPPPVPPTQPPTLPQFSATLALKPTVFTVITRTNHGTLRHRPAFGLVRGQYRNDADVITQEFISEQYLTTLPRSYITQYDVFTSRPHAHYSRSRPGTFARSAKQALVIFSPSSGYHGWYHCRSILEQERVDELTDMLSVCTLHDYPCDDPHLVEGICHGLASLTISDPLVIIKNAASSCEEVDQLARRVALLRIIDDFADAVDCMGASFDSDLTLVECPGATMESEIFKTVHIATADTAELGVLDFEPDKERLWTENTMWKPPFSSIDADQHNKTERLSLDDPIFPSSCLSCTRMLAHALPHILPSALSPLTSTEVLETLHRVARPDLFFPLPPMVSLLIDVD